MKVPEVSAPPAQFLHIRAALKHLTTFGVATLLAHGAWAQGITSAPQPKATASAATATTSLKPAPAKSTARSGPSWTDLSPQQRQNLKPLSGHWDGISEAQKRKWLEISRTYPTLPPADQATMHSRMTEWVGLSSQQRAQARLNFAKTRELSKELTPEQKKAKWQTYQSLSPEEKQKLAAKAAPQHAGAAPAVKPVAPQKLAVLPAREAAVPARAASSPSLAPVAPQKDAVAAPKIAP